MEKLNTAPGHAPFYHQIKEIYRKKILDGELNVGDRVDSEMEIQEIYNVSRITARQAILDLEKEGLVKRGRGKGTFVTYCPAIKEELAHIRSFTDEMKEQGRVPGTAFFSVTKEIPNARVREMFGLKEEEMYCISRVRTADEIRLVYFLSYFPLSLNLPLDESKYDQSLYEMLEKSTIGSPVRIDEEFSAILPTENVCKMLKISRYQPIFLRKRVSYDKNGNEMEYTLCFYRGDMFSYTISTEDKK